ncbi:PilC family type IV pilus tip adhesin [Neisseria sp. HMSC70E02]|uniref:PilC family type IV pilus tip adhesin n=1 Tax=Neisseria sp. HMSC70E02 TaxID=1608896 RepID=UPI000B1CF5F9|nr:PilC family type IV pilus tip adhesin [Neisseria sp. HMSC70E02]
MKNKSSRCPGSIRPMIYSIASALALMGAVSQAQAQFAKTPLYLQNESQIIEQPKIKHNIMFFIDNSGSMSRNAITGGYNFPGQESRMDVTKTALNKVLDKYQDKFNWGLQALVNTENNFSNPDPTKHTKKNYTNSEETFNTSWEQMKTLVDNMGASGYTPATRRYYEVVASAVMPNIKYRCQKSYVVMMSDGDANFSCNHDSTSFHYRFNYDGNNGRRNSNYPKAYLNYEADLYRTKPFITAYNYFGESPMKYFDPYELGNTCRDKRENVHYSKFWDTANRYRGVEGGMAFFSRKLAVKDIKTAAVDRVDAAGVSWDGDPNIDPKGVDYSKQTVQTFTVGFGNGISPAGEQYLIRGASHDGWYFNAAKPDDLYKAFEKIISQISDDNASIPFEGEGGTAPATSSSGIPDLAATIKLNTGSWSSQILFNKLNNSDGRREGTVTQPSFGNRKTLINTGSNTYFIDAIPADKVNNAYFGIENDDKDEWKKLLNWTGRVGRDDSAYKPYRERKAGERDLGDILDGSVAAVGNQEHGRRKYLVAAANDGMVHIFQSTDGNNPYDLKVSYLPSAMERENDASGNPITLAKVLKDIAHADYGKSIENHKYGVNGGFTLRQTAAAEQGSKFQQRVFMFGAMGQGGRGAYALNIGGKEDQTTNTGLDAAAWSDKVPLFETAKGKDNTLGFTIGTPQIGRVSIKRETDGSAKLNENIRYAGFLASGYAAEEKDAAANETALYVYEMLGKEVGTGEKRGQAAGKPGDQLAKIVVKDGVGGLSTPTLLDTDFDGVVDFAFAGDRGGNMYRFDLRGAAPSDWTAVKIFSGSSSKPITSAPAVSRKGTKEYVVIFGTGSEIYQSDLSNTETQSIYGIFQKLDKTPKDLFEDKTNQGVVAQNLREQTITEAEQSYNDGNNQPQTSKALYLSNEKIEEAHKGWFINLRPGERVSLKPTMILRTAIVTIRKYTSDVGKTIGKEEAEKDLCLPVSNNKSTVTSTTFLGINADNGGALNSRSARFTPDIFKRELSGFGTQYANGLTQEGIVSFTFIDPNKRTDDPVTADGDSGETGTDKELGLGSGTPNNKCFSGKEGDQRSLLLNKGESLTVKGRICGLQRISWRELFF